MLKIAVREYCGGLVLWLLEIEFSDKSVTVRYEEHEIMKKMVYCLGLPSWLLTGTHCNV